MGQNCGNHNGINKYLYAWARTAVHCLPVPIQKSLKILVKFNPSTTYHPTLSSAMIANKVYENQ